VKILYHHRTRSKDGQTVHIEELVAALRRLGHDVILVGPRAIERESFGADAGAVAVLKRCLPGAVYELMEFAYAFAAYARLRKAYLEHRPDVLYERYNLFMPAGVWLKHRYKLPMLLEVNAPLVAERSRFGGLALKGLARWSERSVWRGADYVLPVTEALAAFVRDAGVPNDRIVVIPNGVNGDRFFRPFDGVAAKRRLGLKGQLVLGFTGFVRDWHGVDNVIDLIADNPTRLELHLLVVGDGPACPGLEKRARDRGVADRLTITGVIERDSVADYLAAFDVALQPAVNPYASPLKVFEYMALGLAIVAPATANICEIVTDGETALLFDPDDPASLGAAIERICRDDALRERVGAAARQAIEERGLTWENNARRIVALFERLGAGRTP
jgi:glycosyltransferase involved in cell wall biosynthesis